MTERQREPVPFDRRPVRRRNSTGGRPVLGARQTLAPGLDTEAARYPGTVNDTRIARQQMPWYPMDTYTPAGNSWVNWTLAGPCRPELHMRDATYRLMEGNSATRQLLYPAPGPAVTVPGYRSLPDGRIIQPTTTVRVGLHTDPKRAARVTVERYTNRNPRMTTARQDRLRSGQYTGQSYSQTTRIQGASR
jgi:hypothetical protein